MQQNRTDKSDSLTDLNQSAWPAGRAIIPHVPCCQVLH